MVGHPEGQGAAQGLLGSLAGLGGFGSAGHQFLAEKAQRGAENALQDQRIALMGMATGGTVTTLKEEKTIIEELQEETDEWLKDIK